MSTGQHEVDRLAAFAEGELGSVDTAAVSAHLAVCAECRQALADVRRGIAFASELEAESMPAALAGDLRTQLVSPASAGWRWPAAAAALLIIMIGAGSYWQMHRPWAEMTEAAAAPTPFEAEGRALHRALLEGAPLDYRPADDADAWSWLGRQRGPTAGLLPSHSPDERARFVPVGAAVRHVGPARASVVSYRVDGRPVTLVLANTRDVPDAPAAGLWSKRVTHRRDPAGANVLTWTIGGGTYVMVSELDGYGQRACFVCHTDPKFQQTIQSLSPR